MTLADDLSRIRDVAQRFASPGDAVSGILPAEPSEGRRSYVCAFDDADGFRSWLAVRDDGSAVTDRSELRAAISIAALCEIAADAAGGGDLEALVASLRDLREREAPEGIEDAEARALELRETIGEPPQLATPARLDAIGEAARRLERELNADAPSPFLAAMKAAPGVVGELQHEIEAGYRVPLE